VARVRKPGVYSSRGQDFARVRLAGKQRKSVLLVGCASPEEADERATFIFNLVEALRGAGQLALLDLKDDQGNGLLDRAGAATTSEERATVQKLVDSIVAGAWQTRTDAQKAAEKRAAASVVTFESFAMRWVRGELAEAYPDHVERKRSAYTDLCNLRRYVFPVVGPRPIASITLDDYEEVMRQVPQRATTLRTQSKGARARRPDEEARAKAAVATRKLKPGTRRHVAQSMRRVMQLAEYPAKLVARNPIPANAMPRVRTTVALQFLYPDEDVELMGAVAVPLAYRLLYGFLARMGWRKEEVLGGKVERVEGEVEGSDEQLADLPPLTWSRLDLRRGLVYIDRD
jgi:hypothetical protein